MFSGLDGYTALLMFIVLSGSAHLKWVSPLPPPCAFIAACDACFAESFSTFKLTGLNASLNFLHQVPLIVFASSCAMLRNHMYSYQAPHICALMQEP